MLTLTPRASEQLEHQIGMWACMHDQLLRIVPSRENTNTYDLIPDRYKPGDYVVRGREGRDLVLVGPTTATFLTDHILDFNRRKGRGRFVVRRTGTAGFQSYSGTGLA